MLVVNQYQHLAIYLRQLGDCVPNGGPEFKPVQSFVRKLVPVGELPWWIYLGVPLGIGIGIVATVIPIRAGAKAIEEVEF